jgi:hypothetical protein
MIIKAAQLLIFISLLLPIPAIAGEKALPLKQIGPTSTMVCGNCHGWRAPLPQPRSLNAPHDQIALNHGSGRFWCFTCHQAKNPQTLHGVNSTPLPFTAPQSLCQTCHFRQVRDWQGGSHGKRTKSWQGQRTAWRCTACHNPHHPKIAPFQANDPPRKPGRGSDNKQQIQSIIQGTKDHG